MDDSEPAILVGVDWAQQSHRVCVIDTDGNVIEERDVKHKAVDLADLCDRLVSLAKRADAVYVAIERPDGIVVDTMLERGLVVFALNPKQLDRFRDRFCVSGAKDDDRDARVLADSLRTDRRAFRRLVPDDPQTVRLREWSRMHDELQQERVRLAHQIRAQLLRYYPQFVELAPKAAARWALALWRLAPTPAAARKAKHVDVQRILKEHRIRKHNAKSVLAILRQPAMTVAPGVTDAATAHIELLSERVSVINAQLKRCDAQLHSLLEQLAADPDADSGKHGGQRDVTIALSVPGLGPIVAATLLTEASRPLGHRDYQALRALSGVAPVTKRSGKSLVVVRRYACNQRLQNAMYHWARVAVQLDPLSKARYAALRSRGHSHGRAIRSVGDRLLALLCAMLRSGAVFEPNRRKVA